MKEPIAKDLELVDVGLPWLFPRDLVRLAWAVARNGGGLGDEYARFCEAELSKPSPLAELFRHERTHRD